MLEEEIYNKIRTLGQAHGISKECTELLSYNMASEDILLTLERIHDWSLSQSKRKWNFYREIINTIRHDSVFFNTFLSTDLEKRKQVMGTIRSLYQVDALNYRDRLILLTKYILAQINPLGNPEIRERAIKMIQEFIRHKKMEIRNATFRGMTFEVARLKQKGGAWYVQPLVDMLVEILKEDTETREYIRTESMEAYYTQEQRDVVDDILVAVALSLSAHKPGNKD